jgi:hypothetical protein
MKKAQWKEPPLQRAFGQRTEEQHVKTLKHNIWDLEQKAKVTAARIQALSMAHDNMRKKLQQYETANMRYKWLRANGVVLEHDGEFKHLKGDDMDKFFESSPQPLYDMQSSIYAQVLANSMRQTKEAVSQTLIYGSNATHMWLDEEQDPTKWP